MVVSVSVLRLIVQDRHSGRLDLLAVRHVLDRGDSHRRTIGRKDTACEQVILVFIAIAERIPVNADEVVLIDVILIHHLRAEEHLAGAAVQQGHILETAETGIGHQIALALLVGSDGNRPAGTGVPGADPLGVGIAAGIVAGIIARVVAGVGAAALGQVLDRSRQGTLCDRRIGALADDGVQTESDDIEIADVRTHRLRRERCFGSVRIGGGDEDRVAARHVILSTVVQDAAVDTGLAGYLTGIGVDRVLTQVGLGAQGHGAVGGIEYGFGRDDGVAVDAGHVVGLVRNFLGDRPDVLYAATVIGPRTEELLVRGEDLRHVEGGHRIGIVDFVVVVDTDGIDPVAAVLQFVDLQGGGGTEQPRGGRSPSRRVAVEEDLFVRAGRVEVGLGDDLDEVAAAALALGHIHAHRGHRVLRIGRLDVLGRPGGLDREFDRLLLARVESGGVLLLDEGEFAGVIVTDGDGHVAHALVVVDALGDGEVDQVILFIDLRRNPVRLGNIHPDGPALAIRQVERTAAIREGVGVIPGIGGVDAELLGRDLGRGAAGSELDRGVPRFQALVPVDGDGHAVARDGHDGPGTVRRGGHGFPGVDYDGAAASLGGEDHFLGDDLQGRSRQILGAVRVFLGLAGEDAQRCNQSQ